MRGLTEFEFLVCVLSAGSFGGFIFPGMTHADTAGFFLAGGFVFLGLALTILWVKNSGTGNW
jgi:hypothetical protein